MRYCMSAGLALGLALAALACVQVAQAASAGAAALTDATCSCERDLPYQLLRGPDQVSQCQSGYYCDCKAGKKLRCFAFLLTWKYNEDPQVCDLNFDCKKFFDNLPTTPATTVTPPATTPSTTKPTTPPTTKPTTPSTTKPTTPSTTKPTTPSTTKPTTPSTTTPTTPSTTKPTTPSTTTPTTPSTTKPTTPSTTKPTTPSTTKPTTPSTTKPTTHPTPTTEPTAVPSTTPSSPVDPYCLTCDPVTHQRYQLIRGEGEVDKCNERLYCDCEEHTQRQCGWFAALNPDDQKCEMFFSCESWLSGHQWTYAARGAN